MRCLAFQAELQILLGHVEPSLAPPEAGQIERVKPRPRQEWISAQRAINAHANRRSLAGGTGVEVRVDEANLFFLHLWDKST